MLQTHWPHVFKARAFNLEEADCNFGRSKYIYEGRFSLRSIFSAIVQFSLPPSFPVTSTLNIFVIDTASQRGSAVSCTDVVNLSPLKMGLIVVSVLACIPRTWDMNFTISSPAALAL